jgi:hypothetical protein
LEWLNQATGTSRIPAENQTEEDWIPISIDGGVVNVAAPEILRGFGEADEFEAWLSFAGRPLWEGEIPLMMFFGVDSPKRTWWLSALQLVPFGSTIRGEISNNSGDTVNTRLTIHGIAVG